MLPKMAAEVGSVSQLTSLEEKSLKVTDNETLDSLAAPEDDQSAELDEEYAEEDFDEADTVNADTVDAAALPASYDWRSQPAGNYMTNVRNQGQCGSCWAFSAVGVTEAALNIANETTGNNYDLAEQFLVSDCNSGYKIRFPELPRRLERQSPDLYQEIQHCGRKLYGLC